MALRKSERTLSPTPPIGWPIQWYVDAKKTSTPAAAQCIDVEEPGKIVVGISTVRGHQVKRACYHIDEEILKRRRPRDVQSGAWDFVPGLVPKDRYDLAHQKEAKRKAQIEAKEAEALAKEEAAEAETANA